MTSILAILCIIASIAGFRQYNILHSATQDYISCENAAHKLQEGSDILTKQVRLAASTGDPKYITAYFKEANVSRSREKALKTLESLEVPAMTFLHGQKNYRL